jgi:hypothetical protein
MKTKSMSEILIETACKEFKPQPEKILGPIYYTAHGGPPTNDAEWADQNFGVGASYADHGISIDELESDWPEVFSNADCMRGFDPGAYPPPGMWPHESEWEVHELTGRVIPPWLK